MIAAAVGVLGLAAGLVMYALRDSIVYFYSPSDVIEKQLTPGQRVRLGGLVEKGSVTRGEGGRIDFSVTDTKSTMKVVYRGVLPDLFREGQGVVTEGKLDAAGMFTADTVLAKHDETYMPAEVAKCRQEVRSVIVLGMPSSHYAGPTGPVSAIGHLFQCRCRDETGPVCRVSRCSARAGPNTPTTGSYRRSTTASRRSTGEWRIGSRSTRGVLGGIGTVCNLLPIPGERGAQT